MGCPYSIWWNSGREVCLNIMRTVHWYTVLGDYSAYYELANRKNRPKYLHRKFPIHLLRIMSMDGAGRGSPALRKRGKYDSQRSGDAAQLC